MSLCEGVPVCVTASHVKSICKHVRLAARKIITQWVILYIRHQNTNFHTHTHTHTHRRTSDFKQVASIVAVKNQMNI